MTISTSLEALIEKIVPLDGAAMQAAGDRQAQLTKPPGSLGRLESLAVQIAGITGQPVPCLNDKVAIVMAGDHGVTAEGVSAYPAEVTQQMVANFLRGGAAVNVLARHTGARLLVVDLGVAAELEPQPGLLIRKIAAGTGNIACGPAMSRAQARAALLAGAAVVEAELERGLDILATGDMGIGNTTPSTAIAAMLTGDPPSRLAGRGTGLDDSGLARKIAAVERALAVNAPDPRDGLDLLAKVGGFEIGGLAGALLAAAAHRRPAVIDGFISTAAAMLAVQICPPVRDYLIAAHLSQELGHARMLAWLGLEPVLDLDLRLGEGTGALLALGLLEAACKLLAEMATFSQAGVSGRVTR